MNKAYIAHRWEGSPKSDWYEWLQRQLGEKGIQTVIPVMPDTEEPKLDVWVPYLEKVIETLDENTALVGHSIGCQTILRFLQSQRTDTNVGLVLLVAGFVTLKGLESPEEERIAKPWLETPISWGRIKDKSDRFVCIFSEDDPFVPLEDANIFETKLGAEIVMAGNMGHFTDDDGSNELPLLLDFF